jgi:hypothetical protein
MSAEEEIATPASTLLLRTRLAGNMVRIENAICEKLLLA